MNQDEWEKQAGLLMETQEKFITMVRMLMETFQQFREVQQGLREELIARDNWYEAANNESRVQKKLVDTLLESITSLDTAYRQTHLTVQENNERMAKLLTKIEAYFGTTGLDYDNRISGQWAVASGQ